MQRPEERLPKIGGHSLYSNHVTRVLRLILNKARSRVLPDRNQIDADMDNVQLDKYIQSMDDTVRTVDQLQLNVFRDGFADCFYYIITTKDTRTAEETKKKMEIFSERIVKDFLGLSKRNKSLGESKLPQIVISSTLNQFLRRHIFMALKSGMHDFEVNRDYDEGKIPITFKYIGNLSPTEKTDYSYIPDQQVGNEASGVRS